MLVNKNIERLRKQVGLCQDVNTSNLSYRNKCETFLFCNCVCQLTTVFTDSPSKCRIHFDRKLRSSNSLTPGFSKIEICFIRAFLNWLIDPRSSKLDSIHGMHKQVSHWQNSKYSKSMFCKLQKQQEQKKERWLGKKHFFFSY